MRLRSQLRMQVWFAYSCCPSGLLGSALPRDLGGSPRARRLRYSLPVRLGRILQGLPSRHSCLSAMAPQEPQNQTCSTEWKLRRWDGRNQPPATWIRPPSGWENKVPSILIRSQHSEALHSAAVEAEAEPKHLRHLRLHSVSL